MNTNTLPWNKRVRRWGQTNLSEQDPFHYDNEFWRGYWRETRTQGVIVNAGGIVAYYPSRFELHYRARFLGERDLLGEICAAAREEGMAVLARMDSNRATEDFYRAHPDWFTVNPSGEVGRAGERYIACLNSPYTREYLPEVLREITLRYRPDGFTDNSWSGPGRNWICHCAYCRQKFRAATSEDLPVRADWDQAVYRRWVRWSYACRAEIWDLNNRVTREAGGPDCLWLGMINGDPLHSHLSFCDLKDIAGRAEILMSDQQGRGSGGFGQNAQSGKLLHGLLGWDKNIPESMAMYVRGEQAFRKAAAPQLEARKWMVSGFAGGITPWWHHVGAAQEDRRQFKTAPTLLRWHADNEDVLYERRPVANIGLLWSHENIDFYGREQPGRRVAEPWRGFSQALMRARIPYLPLHADFLDQVDLDLLILPDLAALSDRQCGSLRGFVARGGSVIASGLAGMLDAEGQPRPDGGLADLWGVRCLDERLGAEGDRASWENASGHNYLRLNAPLTETDILPFGGTLQAVEALPGSEVYATYVPSFPIYPPETSWMRQARSELPAIVRQTYPSGGRGVYFAADIDRCFGRQGLPDHAWLLEDALGWALGEKRLLDVSGPGLVDCHLYRQDRRLILHLVNLSGCPRDGSGYLEENYPVGPLRVKVRLPGGFTPRRAICRVTGQSLALLSADEWALCTLPELTDHELIVLE
jgi:hypothetical protein